MSAASLIRRFADQSLARKLGLLNVGGLLLAGLLVCALLGYVSWITLRTDLIQNSRTVATVLAQNAAPALQFDDAVTGSEILSALSAHAEVVEAQLLLADGRLFASYHRVRQAQPASGLPLAAAASFGGSTVDVSVPVEAQGAPVGTLRMTIDMARTTHRASMAALSIFVVVLLVFLLLVALQSRLMARLLAPVQSLLSTMRRVADGGDYSQRAVVRSRDEIGEIGESFNAMMSLIEERDQAMEHLAMHDVLTGLFNRHYLRMRARLPELAAGERSALFYIDLDNFKHINDTIDHNFGDRVLAAVANRLIAITGEQDMLVRFGGDEFVLCVNRVRAGVDLVQLADELRAHIGEPLSLQGRQIMVRASVGIAVAPEHGQGLDQLLQKADAAMHVAKDNGRDDVQLWNPAITQRANERFALETDLRNAMMNGDELALAYQPIVELDSGEVVGMEVLARWRHPQRGLVPPSVFIPVAEESGLIVQLGAWVLERSCEQVGRWHDSLGPLFLAVNVAGRQFGDPHFVDTVRSVCDRTGYPTGLLHLEVTESTLMQDTESAARVMDSLVKLGVRLSLDDFGTGYSSLAYLKRFPLHKLKIDRSFVKDLPANADDAAIVSAIVNLGRALDMQVLAEGIESQAQGAMLSAVGCHYGQGYLFSEPLWSADFERFAAERMRARSAARDA